MKKLSTAFIAGVLLVWVRYVAAGYYYVENLPEKCFAGGVLFVCLYILYVSTEEPSK
jgi:hypothetical protein